MFYLDIHLDVRLGIHLDVHLDIHLDVHLKVHLDVHLDIRLDVHLYFHLGAHLGVRRHRTWFRPHEVPVASRPRGALLTSRGHFVRRSHALFLYLTPFSIGL